MPNNRNTNRGLLEEAVEREEQRREEAERRRNERIEMERQARAAQEAYMYGRTYARSSSIWGTSAVFPWADEEQPKKPAPKMIEESKFNKLHEQADIIAQTIRAIYSDSAMNHSKEGFNLKRAVEALEAVLKETPRSSGSVGVDEPKREPSMTVTDVDTVARTVTFSGDNF